MLNLGVDVAQIVNDLGADINVMMGAVEDVRREAAKPSNADKPLAASTSGTHGTITITRASPEIKMTKAFMAGKERDAVMLEAMQKVTFSADALREMGRICMEGGGKSAAFDANAPMSVFRRLEAETEWRQAASAGGGGRKAGAGKPKQTHAQRAFGSWTLARLEREFGSTSHSQSGHGLFPGKTPAFLACTENPCTARLVAEDWGINEYGVATSHVADFDYAFGTFHIDPGTDEDIPLRFNWRVFRGIREAMRASTVYTLHRSVLSSLVACGWDTKFVLALLMRDGAGNVFNTQGCGKAHAERYYAMINGKSFGHAVISTGSCKKAPKKATDLPQPPHSRRTTKRRRMTACPMPHPLPVTTNANPGQGANDGTHARHLPADSRPAQKHAPDSVDPLLLCRDIHYIVLPIGVDALGGIAVLACFACVAGRESSFCVPGLMPVVSVCDLHRISYASASLIEACVEAHRVVACDLLGGKAYPTYKFAADAACGKMTVIPNGEASAVRGEDYNNPVGYTYIVSATACLWDPAHCNITAKDINDNRARARAPRANVHQGFANVFTAMATTTSTPFAPENFHVDMHCLSPSRVARATHHFGGDGKGGITAASLVPHMEHTLGCVPGIRLCDGEYLNALQAAIAVYKVIALNDSETTLPRSFGAFAETVQHRSAVRGMLLNMIESEHRARNAAAGAAICH
tara:strand:- start:204 stop:2285 length:2082 start_codon:yes stop_codon:yes gene_type:complete